MGRLNPIERRLERFLREPPSVRNAAGVIVVATTVVVLGAGVLINLIGPEEYPDIGVGMWWALQTVTTVGYGALTPSEIGVGCSERWRCSRARRSSRSSPRSP
jgi:hypothetical protein